MLQNGRHIGRQQQAKQAIAEVADQIRAFMDRSTPSLVVSESSD